MIRIEFATILAIILSLTTATRADEGMYPVSEIARLNLANHGLKMESADIFNPEKTCLIDGICRVNGCTGSFVSDRGLIITNHHCAYRAIQSASTPVHDHLQNGFSAENLADEIPATGYVVRITESFSDVSAQVLEVVRDEMSFVERTKAMERRQKEIEKQAEADNPGTRAEVAEMFAGKTYLLFHYTFIKDVRLVFAPPASVGNFGGDVDNWEWPRHTGDFSFMRAYVAPDGSTADYSVDNVPYQPKRFIPVAAEGVNEEDFVMLLGYPGRTARHKTASFLRYEQDVRLPFVVDLYDWQIQEMTKAGEDRAVALKHASRIQSLANVEKRSRGQLKGLRRKRIVADRASEEQKLQAFIDGDPERRSKYGSLLKDIDATYAEITEHADYELTLQNLRSACRLLSIALAVYESAVEREKEDLEREPEYMDRNFDRTVQQLKLSQNDLHVPTDKIMLSGMLDRLGKVQQAKSQLLPLESGFAETETKSKFVEHLYQLTNLADSNYLESCLSKSAEELRQEGDSFLNLAVDLYPEFERLRELDKERDGRLGQLYGDLVTVKQAFLDASFVPDANGTLRLTFGHIRGYSPEDAVIKTPITTLGGVIAKTTGVEPFVTPQKIMELYEQKDFGRFAHRTLNDIPVAVLYDTDTTGGNSGSPILNADGELVGVNFDRTFEATINDFAWNSSYSRSLGVDIRYALWITGKVFGANHLLKEMGVD